jgi:3-oxoacyl-[acyl-carrier-protein] synthase II
MKSRTFREVAVTGIGVVTPGGIGVRAFWDSLFADPQPGAVRRIEEFDPSRWLDFRTAKRLDRVAQLGVAAAHEALTDAGLLADPDAPPSSAEGVALLPDLDPERIGVSIGTGIGGVTTLETQIGILAQRGERYVSPFTVPMTMPNAPAAELSLRYRTQGSTQMTTTACASGTDAIAGGARMVADGRADLVIAGGADCSLSPICLAGFANARALSSSGISRPFDARRDGLAASETAGILILEPLEAALARGARIWFTVLGAGSTSDAYHITSPAPKGAGARRCMLEALDDAALQPSDITHINAHATSTPAGDLAEAQAIGAVFGATRPPTTSIKGVTGHSFGAAGAVEAVAVALTMAQRTLPPTAGLTEPDPAIDLDVVTSARDWTPGPVLSNSFGFGGHNAALVLAPHDPA